MHRKLSILFFSRNTRRITHEMSNQWLTKEERKTMISWTNLVPWCSWINVTLHKIMMTTIKLLQWWFQSCSDITLFTRPDCKTSSVVKTSSMLWQPLAKTPYVSDEVMLPQIKRKLTIRNEDNRRGRIVASIVFLFHRYIRVGQDMKLTLQCL